MNRKPVVASSVILMFGMMPLIGNAQAPDHPSSAGPYGPDPQATGLGTQDRTQAPNNAKHAATKAKSDKRLEKQTSVTGQSGKIVGGADVSGAWAGPSGGHKDGSVATGADVAAHDDAGLAGRGK